MFSVFWEAHFTLDKSMRQEFDALRESARLYPSAEARKRRLAELDDLERSFKEVDAGIVAFKNDIETNNRPKTFMGLQIGTPLQWVMVIVLPMIVLTIASVLNLTYKETGAVAAILVLLIGAACIIGAIRLKVRVEAQKNAQPSHLPIAPKPEDRI